MTSARDEGPTILERIEDRLVVRVIAVIAVLSGLRAASGVVNTGEVSASFVASLVFTALLVLAVVAIRRRWVPTLLVGRLVYVGVGILTVVQLTSLAQQRGGGDVPLATASLAAVELGLAGYIVFDRREGRLSAAAVLVGYAVTAGLLGLRPVFLAIIMINLVVIALLADLIVSSRRSIRTAAVREHELARRDELTALPNRRAAVAVLEEVGPQTALVLVDVDRFKEINDERGHAAGDEVLRTIAATIDAELRDVDVAARWGGEEFLLVLRRTDHPEAVAERVRRAVAEATGGVTISAGVSVMGVDETWGQAVRRADVRLYEAKRAGRDRVVAA